MLEVEGKTSLNELSVTTLEAQNFIQPEVKFAEGITLGYEGTGNDKKFRLKDDSLGFTAVPFSFGHVSPAIVFEGDPEFYFSGELLFKVSPATALINSPEILLKCDNNNAIFSDAQHTEIYNALTCDNVTVTNFLTCDDITIDTLHSTDTEISIVDDVVHSDPRYNIGLDLFVER